jgi:hypothetical protein
MRSILFITGLLLGLAPPYPAVGQQPGNVPRIGVIVVSEPESATEPNVGAFPERVA